VVTAFFEFPDESASGAMGRSGVVGLIQKSPVFHQNRHVLYSSGVRGEEGAGGESGRPGS
jgi:hypothetical protein